MLFLRLALTLAMLLLPLVISGRPGWWQGWIAPIMGILFVSINGVLLSRLNPEVLQARSRHSVPKLLFDRVFAVLAALLTLALLVLAGLGVRLDWPQLSLPWVIAGCVLQVAGMIPITWSMVANPFLETSVRIQTDHGHRVIENGPYRVVRHPMYAGLILLNVGLALSYGSGTALIAAILLDLGYAYRTAREDQTLRRELPGYEEFTARTQYRLIPGVW